MPNPLPFLSLSHLYTHVYAHGHTTFVVEGIVILDLHIDSLSLSLSVCVYVYI